MKAFALLLALTFSHTFASAADNCAAQAESYLINVGYTQPARLTGKTSQGLLVYQVRTNDHGGDAAYEVIVDSDCKLISTRLLWAE